MENDEKKNEQQGQQSKQPEQHPESDNLIIELKKDFAAKTAKMQADFDAKIKEKDNIIRQLIADDNENREPQKPSWQVAIERVNKTREYKIF